MSFYEEKVEIPFGAKHLDGIVTIPDAVMEVSTAVIVTHGAGGDMNFRHLVSLAASLASSGFLCLRFTCKGLNLVYRVKAYKVVVEYLNNIKKYTLQNIFVGGRSMGARAAAATVLQLTETGEDIIQGLICLSYPLHPTKQKHSLRTSDLLLIVEPPVLFVSGTADEMCDRTLLEEVIKKMKAPTQVHWIEGGSHGLAVKGRQEKAVLGEINAQVLLWIQEQI
ncbi:testis-expressed protein 30 [Amia ocellicauda]|uniref:testis-expressed protein 30 n=1 Tax=Amia ocellicauda TaxID=2972642 RepID=UPI003463E9C4